MTGRYKVGSHTKHRLLYHFTFIPKYRKQLIRGKLKLRIIELFNECCDANDWKIHKLEVLSEHIHLLIQLNPKDSPATAMQYLKGGSSIVLRKEFASEIRAFLWGDSFWADGYFVESIGEKNEEIIRAYLDKQQTKHSRPRIHHRA
jgi:putative transposase